MFYHGWNGYLNYAFPSDELRSLTCDGLDRTTDNTSENTSVNDVLGGYSVTLVDAIDMLALMGDCCGFVRAVRKIENYVTFHGLDATVQVFETTIRGLGGLLSAHLYASVPYLSKCHIQDYNGSLLKLAMELGERLLPAFETPTGLPLPRLNLLKGPIGGNLMNESCTSGAGSLVLEFGMLSRLTGNMRFDKVARHAFRELFDRRSELDLVGMTLDVTTGNWTPSFKYATGVGANVDSFYEYALKYAVLFNDHEMLKNFTTLYRALKAHSFDGTGLFYNVNYRTGVKANNWFDALSAFFPSVMVLFGDLADAVRTHLFYYKVWLKYGGIPERFKLTAPPTELRLPLTTPMRYVQLELPWYPLRPEFVEATYYLHRATGDPFYLAVGRRILDDIEQRYRTRCGYAGTKNLATGEHSDRMESFFLSETVKYLYLLFDGDADSSRLNRRLGNFVFSTEGHPFWYSRQVLQHAGLHNFNQSNGKTSVKYYDCNDCDEYNEYDDYGDYYNYDDYDNYDNCDNYNHDKIFEKHKADKKINPTDANIEISNLHKYADFYLVDFQCPATWGVTACELYELLVRPDHQFDCGSKFTRGALSDLKTQITAMGSQNIWSGDLDRCQCKIYDRGNDTFEIVVGRIPGLAKGRVARRDRRGDVWVDQLSGLRLKLLRTDTGGRESYRITRIDGIEVQADAAIHVLDKLENVDFGRDSAGQVMLEIGDKNGDVRIKGRVVENII